MKMRQGVRQDVTIELFRDQTGVWRPSGAEIAQDNWTQHIDEQEAAATLSFSRVGVFRMGLFFVATCVTLMVGLLRRIFDGRKNGWLRTSQHPV